MKKLVLPFVSFAWLAFLHGCAPLRSNPDMIPVESDPSGAEVYVMGKKVGITPLEVRQIDVFPLTYSPEQQDLYGKIVLKKEGCTEHRQPVSTKVYAKGAKIKLDCGGAAPEAAKATRPAAPETSSVENRLRQLKDLREKGLITEEEEKETRQRILKDL